MSLQITTSWLLAAILLSVRLGMVLVITPILGGARLPARVRLFLVLSFALAFSNLIVDFNTARDLSLSNFPFLLINEVIWGGFMAFGLLCAFGAFMLAGRMLDLQIGFGMANLVDPTTRNNAPLLGVALELFAITCFLAADLHHLVLKGLAKSLQLVPLGSSPLQLPFSYLFQHFGMIFTLGVVLVAAVIVCLLLIDVGMAVSSRVLPQANIFILSIPVKIFVGLSVLALAILYMQPAMNKIFSQALSFFDVLNLSH